jgi:hypothetical protein
MNFDAVLHVKPKGLKGSMEVFNILDPRVIESLSQ